MNREQQAFVDALYMDKSNNCHSSMTMERNRNPADKQSCAERAEDCGMWSAPQ